MVDEIYQLHQLNERVKAAAIRSQRDFHDIAILAAAKYSDIEPINRLISAGLTLVGENKVQDAVKKFPSLLPVKKHFIGHLQTNKVKQAVKLFDVIESVDRIEVAQSIHEEAQRMNKIMPIYVQVNVGQDAKKFGLGPAQTLIFLQELKDFSCLQITGLMAILPYFENAEDARPYFRTMKTLFDFARQQVKGVKNLSMGMSHDFEVAIEEGSTEIRVGSFLFGKG